MNKFTFTSESVSEGHPDKVCDALSDAILDEYLLQDSNSRVACETLATTGTVIVSGEVTSSGSIDVEKIVKETLNDNIETFSNTPSPSESLTNFQKFITFVKKLSVILLDEKRAIHTGFVLIIIAIFIGITILVVI